MTTVRDIRKLMQSDEFSELADIIALGDDAIPPLIRLAKKTDEPAFIRQRALVTLGEMQAEAASRPLRKLLTDPDRSIRVMAIRALAKIEGVGSVNDLLPMLSDPEASVGIAAAKALEQLIEANEHAAEAIEALGALPDNAHPSLQRAAEQARATIRGRIE